MNMKRFFAVLAATAVSAASFATMSFSASAAEIAYTESEGSMATDNDGVSLRRNIINVWGGNNVTDMAESTVIEDKVTVNFTVSGIGDTSSNFNTDGTKGDDYYAWLAGSIGANPQVWTQDDAADFKVPITGDGDYTVTWDLAEDADTVLCLILQTNINFYAYGNSIEESGVVLTVNSITTGAEETTDAPADDTTDAPADDTTDAPADDTTDAPSEDATDADTNSGSGDADADTDADTNTGSGDANDDADTNSGSGNNNSGSNNTGSTGGSTNEESAPTGVAGVGALVAAMTLAGAAAFATRKR